MKSQLFSLLLVALPMQASAFYKCDDGQGEISYQKYPCGPTATQKQVRVYVPKQTGLENTSEFTGDDTATPASTPDQSAIQLYSEISTAIASLTPIKMSAMEYHSMNGSWPKKLADIRLNKKAMKSRHIESVKLAKQGRIIAHLNKRFGSNKKIILKPKEVLGGTNLEWVCYANFTKSALSYNNRAICESKNIN